MKLILLALLLLVSGCGKERTTFEMLQYLGLTEKTELTIVPIVSNSGRFSGYGCSVTPLETK